MSTKKKLVVALLVLFVAFSAFAEESQSNLNVFGGTSVFVSHVGASYSLGDWEFGGMFCSAFPNVGFISYFNATEGENPNLLECLGESFKLGYAGTIYASYDLIKSEKLDFDLGFSIAGLYSEFLEDLGLDARFGIVSADVTTKLQFNFGKHSGIYFASELPLAGALIINETTDGEETNEASFFTVAMDGYLTAALALVAYTARVGYVYRF